MAMSWGNAETISERPGNQPATTAGFDATPRDGMGCLLPQPGAGGGKPAGDQGGSA
jgi:hypothetical protein